MFIPKLRIVGIAAAVLAIGSLGTLPAQAGSATNNVTVSASITQNCTVGTANIGFGAYDPVVAQRTAALNQSTTISLTCTKGATGITLGLGPSANTSLTPCIAPLRCLTSGTNTLSYNLYSDSPGGTVWNSPIGESVTGGITTATSVTIYGQIPGGQDATVASYTDTVVATVNY